MTDLHVHSSFSDGKNTPEEIVQEAIRKGIKRLGFSDHSYTAFDERYCMPKSRIAEYKRCIGELKVKYADKLEILCGIEQDLFSNESLDGYDYVIGSAHYIHVNGEYIGVDESEDALLNAAKRHFGGDLIALAEEYWRTVACVAERTGADIIGHLDLITKFNEDGRLFNERVRVMSAHRERRWTDFCSAASPSRSTREQCQEGTAVSHIPLWR